MKELWYKITGRMYLVNKTTKVIHSIENKTKICKLENLPESVAKRVTWREAVLLAETGYTFCKWCFKGSILDSNLKGRARLLLY